MSLSSLHLDAFFAVARLKSFSKAANQLHVTQSALSQRVINLEQELGQTLFIREASGLRLTEIGQKLFRYCHSRSLLEDEFWSNLRDEDATSLGGRVRIGAFSTVSRSVVLPTMAKLTRKYRRIDLELITAEVSALPGLLYSGAVDYVIATDAIEKQGVENHRIGFEENVLIQSSSVETREDVYLDHDEGDMTTLSFLKDQKQKRQIKRRFFLDEIYALIDGVRLGLGRAVVPLHLLESSRGIEIVKGFTPQKTPVYLSYYAQSFYTDLQKLTLKHLLEHLPTFLRIEGKGS